MDNKSINELLNENTNEELSDQISELMYEDEPMSEEGYNELLYRWQKSNTSCSELPLIEKLSYSIRKGDGDNQMIYTGEDVKAASYDPFAIYGIDDIDEETAIRNEMADFVISFVRDILDKDGDSLGYLDITNRDEATPEQISKNDRIISELRTQAKSSEDYICLKEKLDSIRKTAQSNSWAKINYEEEGQCFAGVTFGTATEAHLVLLELRDPNAYVYKTRIYTGENGFDKEEERLTGEDLALLLSNENKAREAWAKQMNAEPAIGQNRNDKQPSKKPKSIKRKT